MINPAELLKIFQSLDWDHYVKLCNELVTIDKDNLNEELTTHPRLFSYFSGMLALAKRDLDAAEIEIETFSATKKKEVLAQTSGKLSKDNLDNEVKRTEEFKLLSIKRADLEKKYLLIKSLVQSLDHKSSMIIQLSANNRAETNLIANS